MLRAAPLAFAVLLFGASAVLAGEPMAPSEIQTAFFTGQASPLFPAEKISGRFKESRPLSQRRLPSGRNNALK